MEYTIIRSRRKTVAIHITAEGAVQVHGMKAYQLEQEVRMY